MARDLKHAIDRSRDTLVGDAIGAVSLLVLLVFGLSLPGLV